MDRHDVIQNAGNFVISLLTLISDIIDLSTQAREKRALSSGSPKEIEISANTAYNKSPRNK